MRAEHRIENDMTVKVKGEPGYDFYHRKIDSRIFGAVGVVSMSGGVAYHPRERVWYVSFIVGTKAKKVVSFAFRESELVRSSNPPEKRGV